MLEAKLVQLARFFDSILISCGLAGAFSDYFGLIGSVKTELPAPVSPCLH